MSDSVNISARFPRQLVQAIEHRAELEERSLSAILRRAATLYLNGEEKQREPPKQVAA